MFGRHRVYGRGARRVPGQMNKLEAAYARELDKLIMEGSVAQYLFEGVKLKLADNTFFTPDFFVMNGDGAIEFHEVKGGHIEDDAMVKIKCAAEKFPFRFFIIRGLPKRDGGGFSTEEV